MGCCSIRQSFIQFELIYRVYPAKPEQRIVRFDLELPKDFKEPTITALLEERILQMSLPKEIKAVIRSHSYYFNDLPVNQSTMSMENIKKGANTIFIEEII